jgi:hypothetical protein
MTGDIRRLLRTWAILMALSVGMAFAADATRASRLGFFWIAAICAVALVKARFVLADYLELRRAPGALSGFVFAIVAILAVVGLSFLVPAGLFVPR